MTNVTRMNSAGLTNKANFIIGAIHGYGTKPKMPIKAVGQIMIRKNQIHTEIDKACHLVDTIDPTVIPRMRKKKIRLIEKKYIDKSHSFEKLFPLTNPIAKLIP